jgi:adenylate cyclase class IV
MEKNIEMELKFEVTPEDIERIKKDKRVILSEEVYQSTTMFDNFNQLMEYTGGRVRLRIQGNKATFSYKKRLPSEGIEKKEIEFETEVGNVESMVNILRMMGYAPTTSYEKYVAIGDIDGLTTIEIQRYPFAMFVEIEGEKDEIKEAAKKLGFDIKNSLSKPVDTLFCEWRSSKGLPFKPHMTFSDYDK